MSRCIQAKAAIDRSTIALTGAASHMRRRCTASDTGADTASDVGAEIGVCAANAGTYAPFGM